VASGGGETVRPNLLERVPVVRPVDLWRAQREWERRGVGALVRRRWGSALVRMGNMTVGGRERRWRWGSRAGGGGRRWGRPERSAGGGLVASAAGNSSVSGGAGRWR
jgi:hypothetical protein